MEDRWPGLNRHPAPPEAGPEPVTARSALGLRLVLSARGVALFLLLTVLFAVRAVWSGPHGSPSSTVLAAFCGLSAPACGA